eukprot:scaffold738_cov349-Prasinococcus_capsulatus_cf.AAC.3
MPAAASGRPARRGCICRSTCPSVALHRRELAARTVGVGRRDKGGREAGRRPPHSGRGRRFVRRAAWLGEDLLHNEASASAIAYAGSNRALGPCVCRTAAFPAWVATR